MKFLTLLTAYILSLLIICPILDVICTIDTDPIRISLLAVITIIHLSACAYLMIQLGKYLPHREES